MLVRLDQQHTSRRLTLIRLSGGRWRSEGAHRNALNAHCYWMLRGDGQSVRQATSRIEGLSISAKNELFFQREINFNDLSAWQKRGTGHFWETYEKRGEDPRTGEGTVAIRGRVSVDHDLPLGDAYGDYIQGVIASDR